MTNLPSRRSSVAFWLRHPVDLWWAWGVKTTYYVRVGPVRIPVWRTAGMPYEIRRAIKRGEQ